MKFVALLVFSVFPLLVSAQPELKGSPDDLRLFLYPSDKVVTIHGDALEKAYTDRAILSLVVSTEDELLSIAISENNNLRRQITKSLVAKGLPLEAIKSSKFSSSPQYGWFGKKPASFKVVNRMAITIEDEAFLKEIAAVADGSQDVELSGTEFEHAKKDAFKDKVKKQALNRIMSQKTFYEESLGLKLLPIGIRDSNIRQQASRGARVLEEIVVTARKLGGDSYSSAGKQRRAAPESSFDEVVYEASLSVDFKIQQ